MFKISRKRYVFAVVAGVLAVVAGLIVAASQRRAEPGPDTADGAGQVERNASDRVGQAAEESTTRVQMADLQRVLVDGDDAAKAVALRAIDGMLAEGSMTTPEMVEFCKAAFSNEDEAVRATAEPIIRKYADKTTLAVLNFGILGSISIVGRSQAETAELARGHDRALSYLVLLARDRSFLVKKAFRDLDAASPPHALYGVKFLRELATYLPFVKQEFGKRFGI